MEGKCDMYVFSLLGRFQMMGESGVLNEETMRSEMLVKLLSFLITNRGHALNVQDLVSALWQQDEIDNPEGALKNLMYRLRIMLKKAFGEECFILTKRGAYAWNSEIKVLVDSEEFERHYTEARKPNISRAESIAAYEAAMDLYQGSFLSKYTDLHWVTPLSTYYHSLFLSGAKELSDSYIAVARYSEVEQFCARALKLDSADEHLHYNMLKALIFQKKKDLALEYYNKVEKLLHSSYGEQHLELLETLRDELYQIQTSSQAAQIEVIHQNMQEEDVTGAFICAFPIFKEIYRLEARKIKRFEIPEYVVLLTLEYHKGLSKDNKKLEDFLLGKMMDKLELILKDSLRVGDVASRYSDSQFIILLPSASYEAGMMVANRIIQKLYQETKHKHIKVKTDIEEVTVTEPFHNTDQTYQRSCQQ